MEIQTKNEEKSLTIFRNVSRSPSWCDVVDASRANLNNCFIAGLTKLRSMIYPSRPRGKTAGRESETRTNPDIAQTRWLLRIFQFWDNQTEVESRGSFEFTIH